VGIPSRYVTSQLGQLSLASLPPGSLNRVPASAGVRAGMSPLSGSRCDPIWHVSSCSGVATLRTAIDLLLTYFSRLTRVCPMPFLHMEAVEG